jgi:hypothetical protein
VYPNVSAYSNLKEGFENDSVHSSSIKVNTFLTVEPLSFFRNGFRSIIVVFSNMRFCTLVVCIITNGLILITTHDK